MIRDVIDTFKTTALTFYKKFLRKVEFRQVPQTETFNLSIIPFCLVPFCNPMFEVSTVNQRNIMGEKN